MTVAARANRVPNWRLRREFARRCELGWITLSDVALRLGWSHDSGRVHRELGLAEWSDGRGGGRQRTINYDLAVRICDAIGCDPHEVGL